MSKPEVDKLYLTPWDPAGIVRVLAIEEGGYPYNKPMVVVRFEEDHPAGYAAGELGRYFADELREVPCG